MSEGGIKNAEMMEGGSTESCQVGGQGSGECSMEGIEGLKLMLEAKKGQRVTHREHRNPNQQSIPVRCVDILQGVEIEEDLEGLEPHWQHGCDGFFDGLRMLVLHHEEGMDTRIEHGNGSSARRGRMNLPSCQITRK